MDGTFTKILSLIYRGSALIGAILLTGFWFMILSHPKKFSYLKKRKANGKVCLYILLQPRHSVTKVLLRILLFSGRICGSWGFGWRWCWQAAPERCKQPRELARAGKSLPFLWPAAPGWYRCRNADARLTRWTNGKDADAALTFFPDIPALWHLLVI